MSPRALLKAGLLAAAIIAPNVLGSDPDWNRELLEVEEEYDGARLAISRDPPYPCSRDRGVLYSYDVYPHDTCLSANFRYDRNVMIVNPGRCKTDGKPPYFALYHTRDCTGWHSHPPWYDSESRVPSALAYRYGLPICLSNPLQDQELPDTPNNVPKGDWSMVFRCTDRDEAQRAQGAEAVLTIYEPPAISDEDEQYQPPSQNWGIISDTACRTPVLNIPTHLTSYPEPDTCLEIEPQLKLKIWKTPTCRNGLKSRLARYRGTGCHGNPVSVREITPNMMGNWDDSSCIDMGNDMEAASYSFHCTGLKSEDLNMDNDGNKPLASSDRPTRKSKTRKPARPAKPSRTSRPSSRSDSAWGQWLMVIPLFFVVVIILGTFAVIVFAYSAAFFTLLNRFIMFFDREGREGQIALR